MNNLYEALEICLQEIEQGVDVDTVLFRYPDLADDLRPILETAANARNMSVPAPSEDVVRRNRAKVLQHAAQMRESKARASARRFWSASLRRVAVTLVVVTALFVSSTGLVRAASTTLPGDNLYPVKRTWEDVLVLFTFNTQQRQTLEVEHENERLYELQELFAKGRSVEVDFAGVVTNQTGSDWLVSGIPVIVSAQTNLHDPGIVPGSPVRVKGHTQSNGAVLAEEIELLPPGARLPNAGDEQEKEFENQEENSGKGSGGETPKIEGTQNPESGSGTIVETDKSGSNSGPDSGSNQDSHHNDGSSSGSGHDSGGDSGGSNNGSDGGGDG